MHIVDCAVSQTLIVNHDTQLTILEVGKLHVKLGIQKIDDASTYQVVVLRKQSELVDLCCLHEALDEASIDTQLCLNA